MAGAQKKGTAFELRIRAVLLNLEQECPESVALEYQPRLILTNGEVYRPDFYLLVEYPNEWGHYYFEVQDHKRLDARRILQRIDYMRSNQARKTFVYIYNHGAAARALQALWDAGIMAMSLEQFEQWAENLRRSLMVLAFASGERTLHLRPGAEFPPAKEVARCLRSTLQVTASGTQASAKTTLLLLQLSEALGLDLRDRGVFVKQEEKGDRAMLGS